MLIHLTLLISGASRRIDDNWRLFVRFRQYDIINNQSRRAVKKQTAYYAKCDYPIVGAGIECSF